MPLPEFLFQYYSKYKEVVYRICLLCKPSPEVLLWKTVVESLQAITTCVF